MGALQAYIHLQTNYDFATFVQRLKQNVASQTGLKITYNPSCNIETLIEKLSLRHPDGFYRKMQEQGYSLKETNQLTSMLSDHRDYLINKYINRFHPFHLYSKQLNRGCGISERYNISWLPSFFEGKIVFGFSYSYNTIGYFNNVVILQLANTVIEMGGGVLQMDDDMGDDYLPFLEINEQNLPTIHQYLEFRPEYHSHLSYKEAVNYEKFKP